jgi:hypothetical protein
MNSENGTIYVCVYSLAEINAYIFLQTNIILIMKNAVVDMDISMWLTMTILTGRCMLLVVVLTLQSTARVTDTMPLLTLLPKRYITTSINLYLVS